MTDDRKTSMELDEILTRAVDRQIAEQRALRQSLDELRDSVRDLANRPPARVDLSPVEDRIKSMVDLTPLEDKIRNIVESSSRTSNDNIRGLVETSVLGASESTFASISEQLRSFREAVVPKLEQMVESNPAVQALTHEITAVRETVGGVATDLEGIAQALIDFNSGLRGWASGLDESVNSIRLTVGELFAVATQPAPSTTTEFAPPASAEDTAATRGTRPAGPDETPQAVEERLRETTELSEYLADQIEDLDGLMGRLTELPQQLEGVVSQALKRTLTARAKLDREAETALDDVLAALDEHVTQLTDVIGRFQQEEDHIRKLALEQVELSSRVESLQESFLDRIDRIDNERRRGEEAIAVAIDRSARGLAPRALESLSKSTKRRKPTPPRRSVKAKASTQRGSAAKTAARKQAKRKATRKSPRKPRRMDWTPLPNANDEPSA